jgi:hypothetical protein
LSGLLLLRQELKPHHHLPVAITFGIPGIGDGMDGVMSGFLATILTILTIMRGGFLVTGSIAVEDGIGLRATGGIDRRVWKPMKTSTQDENFGALSDNLWHFVTAAGGE